MGITYTWLSLNFSPAVSAEPTPDIWVPLYYTELIYLSPCHEVLWSVLSSYLNFSVTFGPAHYTVLEILASVLVLLLPHWLLLLGLFSWSLLILDFCLLGGCPRVSLQTSSLSSVLVCMFILRFNTIYMLMTTCACFSLDLS